MKSLLQRYDLEIKTSRIDTLYYSLFILICYCQIGIKKYSNKRISYCYILYVVYNFSPSTYNLSILEIYS